MASKACTRFGSARRIRLRNASTCPIMTKLFQKQPRSIKAEASAREGFSQKRLTRQILPEGQAARGSPGSIQPYSTSGLFGAMPSKTTNTALDSEAAKAEPA